VKWIGDYISEEAEQKGEQTLMGGCPPTNHENSDMAFVARGLVPRHTPAEDKPRRYVAELFSEQ
jgi:hypothetical protein